MAYTATRTRRRADTRLRDSLTGLANADAAHATLAEWQMRAGAEGRTAPVHTMLIALGRFDTVNLAYGSATGDGALIAVARRIVHFADDEFDAGDWIVARLSGGKFLLAAHEPCSRERWQWLAEALADGIAHPITGLDAAGALRLWPRCALMRPAPGEGPSLIFDRLAETIEEARNLKGRRIVWADGGLTIPGRRSADVEADLLTAIDREEIEVVYQPQFALQGGSILGAEALARWQHPQLGKIGAAQLFAIAERVDHVAQLSRHIAARAFKDAASWPACQRLSINITPADLSAQNFVPEFLGLLEKTGFSPERLTVEITEHVLLADLQQCAAVLGHLKQLGISIALDDFGAGFCNFRYLKILPIDTIKLDRAMVEGIATDASDLAVLRAIIAMAGALDMSVMVEGVETQAQHDLVRREGCDGYQGFYGAGPLNHAAFVKLSGA
ncbi:EAL domain-containing protein [Pontixanthobacter sp.]|uniref:EAL domain-containing protein n=1 Tax=Pontixanthobacter sp. TaxID=2792078 RepID=UPI003C7B2E6F